MATRLRSWRLIRRVVFDVMETLSVEAVLRYARRNLGRRYLTLERRRPFRLIMDEGNLVFLPASGRKFWAQLNECIEQFNRVPSFRPSDYSVNIWSRSYFVSLVASMLGERRTTTRRQRRVGAQERLTVPSPAFDRKVRYLRKRGIVGVPLGQARPERVGALAVQFKRDPAVKAWVLDYADGHCELCKKPAPFLDAEGEPFLELHHVVALADGGPDTVTNAAALCPNCHRGCHLSHRRKKLAAKLYHLCARLLPLP